MMYNTYILQLFPGITVYMLFLANIIILIQE